MHINSLVLSLSGRQFVNFPVVGHYFDTFFSILIFVNSVKMSVTLSIHINHQTLIVNLIITNLLIIHIMSVKTCSCLTELKFSLVLNVSERVEKVTA